MTNAIRPMVMVLAASLFDTRVTAASDFRANPMHVAESSPIRRRLLLPGSEYHGSEVHARSGERWLGLMRTPDGYRTAMVTLRIDAVRDRVVDAEKERTGKSIAVAQGGDAVFLLKGFDHLAGRVSRTAADGEFRLPPHSFSTIHFAGRKIEILVQPSGQTEEYEPGKQVDIQRVSIRQGDQMNTLPLVVTEGFNQVSLLWAGDLDGDGKIDFLFEDSGYNWASARLFLSTAAKPGEVVAEVGQFYRSGC